ncbi:MAG UNVERIFIED_CONTAM: hypothetical protein LVT10_16295 [Anaerolineae bacterium]
MELADGMPFSSSLYICTRACSSQSVALSTVEVEHHVRCLRAEELQLELRQ